VGGSADPSRSISVEKQTGSSASGSRVRNVLTSPTRSQLSHPVGDSALVAQEKAPIIGESLATTSLDAEVKPLHSVPIRLSPQSEAEPELVDATDGDSDKDDLEFAQATYEMLLAKYQLIYARNKARMAAKAAAKQS